LILYSGLFQGTEVDDWSRMEDARLLTTTKLQHSGADIPFIP